jgi:tetratricopeptide (TPR) repeat protein
MQLGAVLISTEGYTSPELERLCRRTELLCERQNDTSVPVRYGLWAVRFMGSTPEEVQPFVDWYAQMIERGCPPADQMMAHAAIGVHAAARARYDRARHYLERTIALFDPAAHAGVVQIYGGCGGFYAHIVLTQVLWHVGRFGEADRHACGAVAQAEALDPYTLSCMLAWQMSMAIAAGDIARAEALSDRVQALCARHEFPYVALWAMCGRGWLAARRGEAERAIGDLSTGTDGIRQIGIKSWSPRCWSLYADSAIALGQFDRAGRVLDEALEMSRTCVDCSEEPELLRLRGRLILGRDGSPRGRAAARASFAEALALARQRGALALALRAALDLAALLRDDHPGEAAAVLGPVCRELAPDAGDPQLVAARQLLAGLPEPA